MAKAAALKTIKIVTINGSRKVKAIIISPRISVTPMCNTDGEFEKRGAWVITDPVSGFNYQPIFSRKDAALKFARRLSAAFAGDPLAGSVIDPMKGFIVKPTRFEEVKSWLKANQP